MWEDFYLWVEQYAGSSYDLTADLNDLKGDNIFINPMGWKIKFNYVIEELNEMLDIVDKYKMMLPDHFPSYIALRNFLISETLTDIIESINDIKRKLNIEPVDINNVDNLTQHALHLFEVVNTLSVYSLEQLSKQDWFDQYNEDHDDFLIDQFGIHKNDITNMHFIVNDIIQLHDEDDE